MKPLVPSVKDSVSEPIKLYPSGVWQSAPGSRKALKPIEFWGYEASPFSRIVKVGPPCVVLTSERVKRGPSDCHGTRCALTCARA